MCACPSDAPCPTAARTVARGVCTRCPSRCRIRARKTLSPMGAPRVPLPPRTPAALNRNTSLAQRTPALTSPCRAHAVSSRNGDTRARNPSRCIRASPTANPNPARARSARGRRPLSRNPCPRPPTHRARPTDRASWGRRRQPPARPPARRRTLRPTARAPPADACRRGISARQRLDGRCNAASPQAVARAPSARTLNQTCAGTLAHKSFATCRAPIDAERNRGRARGRRSLFWRVQALKRRCK